MPDSLMPPHNAQRLYRYAWLLVGYTVMIILWGAWVRISGSGAGCGDHWPLCNGEAIPLGSNTKTWTEFAHRASTGVYGVLVLALLVWVRRRFPRHHPSRTYSALVLLFTITEALIGRMLVTKGLVDESIDLSRVIVMPLHLVNTTLLLFACVATAESVAHEQAYRESSSHSPPRLRIAATPLIWCIAGVLCIVTTGSIAALGAHLAPAHSLSDGLAGDIAASSHLAVRLRLLHPLIALVLSVAFLLVGEHLALRATSQATARWLRRFKVCVVAAMGIGICTLLSLSPVVLKMLHLLFANLVVVIGSGWVFHARRGAPSEPG